jgi:hypothetical protein
MGTSVALSGDGNTVFAGAPVEHGDIGAVWVFTRSNGVWTQRQKLVGTGITGPVAYQGSSVALSTDGRTAMVGGRADNSGMGAAWPYVAAATHDFSSDGKADIAWRDGNGDLAFWLMNGAGVITSGGLGGVPSTWSIVGQRDFNGDSRYDLLWRDTAKTWGDACWQNTI